MPLVQTIPSLGRHHHSLTLISLLVLWTSFIFSTALTEVMFVTALLLWIFGKIQRRQVKPEIDHTLLLPLVLLLAWTAFSILWSEATNSSVRGFFKVAQQIFLFVIVADTFQSAKDLRRWEILFLIVMGVLTLNGWFQFFKGHDLLRGFASEDSGAGVRLTASFKTYGLFACYLITTLPIAGMLALRDRLDAKRWPLAALYGIVLVLGIPLLFLTKSRGAMLAFVIGIFALLAYYRKFRVLGLMTILILLSILVLPPSVIIHFDDSHREQSLVERFDLWGRAVHVIQAKPLTGTGINTYATSHQKYDKTQSWRVKNYYAHNGYLQLAAELGLPGLLFFLGFIFRFFQQMMRLAQPWKNSVKKSYSFEIMGFVTVAAIFLIFALVDTVLHNGQPALAFWFMAGLCVSYSKRLDCSS